MRKKGIHNMNKHVVIILMICIGVLFCLCFFFVQVVNASTTLKESDSFGIGNHRFKVDSQVGVISNNEFSDVESFKASQTSLATYTTRDISTAISSISYQIEQNALAMAQAAHAAELIDINRAKNNRIEFEKHYSMPSGLSEIN